MKQTRKHDGSQEVGTGERIVGTGPWIPGPRAGGAGRQAEQRPRQQCEAGQLVSVVDGSVWSLESGAWPSPEGRRGSSPPPRQARVLPCQGPGGPIWSLQMLDLPSLLRKGWGGFSVLSSSWKALSACVPGLYTDLGREIRPRIFWPRHPGHWVCRPRPPPAPPAGLELSPPL